MNLTERCETFRRTLGVPATEFCKRIELAPSSYYGWRAGKVLLSEKKRQQISDYLSKYRF